jgi:Mlc titration factor MtfA (ptsG expression regulator)
MTGKITSVDQLRDYYRASLSFAKFWTLAITCVAAGFFVILGYFSDQPALYVFAVIVAVAIVFYHKRYYRHEYLHWQQMKVPFPAEWRYVLDDRVVFYRDLNASGKLLFEKRIQLFLSEKKIEGVGTDIDETVRLLVASSAIIPTFAFPAFTYPGLSEVLIYPKSFSKTFETGGANKEEEHIEGMVGNRFMNRSLLLSKPALLAGFNGRAGEDNVGIHEFVHLLDREDGEADGIPEKLMQHEYVLPWLHLIKKETDRIKKGRLDLNPYALTNNAEFLAVVSEYFFNDPEDFAENHPELYTFLTDFYDQKLSRQTR